MLKERRESRVQMGRSRRQGGMHNILLMNLARGIVLPGDRTLGEYFSLKVVQISDKMQGGIPVALQHLVYKHYNIGPNGCQIGTGPQCNIKLPAMALTSDAPVHAEIIWRKDGGCFELQDSSGKMKDEQQKDVSFPLQLSNGQEFITGRVVWRVIGLPADVVFNLKLFAAARSKSLSLLKQQIEEEEERSKRRHSSEERRFSVVEYLQVTSQEQLSQPVLTEGIDINIVDDQDNNCHGNTAAVPMAKMLLHVAIENKDEAMMRYLLDKGSDVNRCVGLLGLNALHIAARCNNEVAMEMLLANGGDLEIQDHDNNSVLSWTTNYKIRCMILHTTLLCCAAYDGDIITVRQLLNNTQASPNALGLKHKNALHHAAFAGHEAIVRLLLDHGAKVNALGGSRNRTPLHYASVAGHVGMAKVLKEANADLTIKDKDGYTAINLTKGGEICDVLHQGPVGLCEAVRRGDFKEANYMLANGQYNVDQRNEQGHAPLHIACVLGYIDHVKLLVEHGADVNIKGGTNQWTPLFYAAQSGHEAVVELLLDIGADPQVTDADGKTVRQGIEATIDELAKRLNTPHLESVTTWTVPASNLPLDTSITNQLKSRITLLTQVLKLLNSPTEKLIMALDGKDLAEFGNLLAGDATLSNVVMDTDEHDRMSILCIACEMGAYAFVQLLLEHGAKPSGDAVENNCPLHISCYNGHTDIVMLLVNHSDIKINQQATDTLSTALHVAASENFLEVTEQLLKAGADAALTNANGEKPYDCARLDAIKRLLATGANKLHYYALHGNEQEVCSLIEQDQIPVDAESYHGNTALHEASRCGHMGTVKQLIKFGADVNKTNGKSGRTALHLASAADHIAVVQVLLSKGAKRDVKDNEGKVPFEVARSQKMRHQLINLKKPKTLDNAPSLPRASLTANLCCICFDRTVNTILRPCNHERLCMVCAEKIRDPNHGNNRCPLDKQIIMDVIRVNT